MNDNLQHILAMGGYGAYVWTTYAITLFVFSVNFVSSFRENRRIKKIIKQQLISANKSS